MPIEFKYPDGEPILIGDGHREIQAARRVGRRFMTDGRTAFDIYADGKVRTRLLEEYEHFQERERLAKPADAVAQESLRVSEENVVPVPYVAVEQAAPEIPNPLDWYDAEIYNVLQGGRDVVCILENNQRAIANERDFVLRDFGHSLCLKNRKAWVRIEPNSPGHRHRYSFRVLEAQIVNGNETGRQQTTGTVIMWSGSLGVARMSCGACSIQIGTRGADDVLDLRPNQKIEFCVYFNQRLKKHLGAVSADTVGEKCNGI
jgi:hypothetical protein